MAQVSIMTDWRLTLTTAELRLVLKALGGRLKPEDMEDAKNLGDQLSRARAQVTAHALRETDKLMQNINHKDDT